MTTKRGSRWRKWDLHVHVPTTRLNNQYRTVGDEDKWEKFCQILHDSDASAIGITDYFDLRSYFEFKRRYAEVYPNDNSKTFFPNLELRLDKFFNKKIQHANVHVLFRPELTEQDALSFSYNLKLAQTDSDLDRRIPIKQVEDWSREKLEGAMVSIEDIHTAIRDTFSGLGHASDGAIIIASGRTDGLSPSGSESQRNFNSIDELDKKVDAIFSRSEDADHWLDTSRLGDSGVARAKPTFGGCDAHSFEDLEQMLGRSGSNDKRRWETTWIKADPTYDGLLQTLAEPRERVRIQPNEPDTKADMYVIDRIEFKDSEQFPPAVHFGRNLNAVIGSRSSGKSALLAYIAHGANPDETIRQQENANVHGARDVGPAAGMTWQEAACVHREIVWASGARTTGGIVYVPQNSLYSLSSRPQEVSDKIGPVLFNKFPDLETQFDQYSSQAAANAQSISTLVGEWFEWTTAEASASDALVNLGSKSSIEESHNDVKRRLALAKSELALSEDELNSHDSLQEALTRLDTTAQKSDNERLSADRSLGAPSPSSEDSASPTPRAKVSLSSNLSELPEELRVLLESEIRSIREAADARLATLYHAWKKQSEDKGTLASRTAMELREKNSTLLTKVSEAAVVDELSKEHQRHQALLAQLREAADEIENFKSSREGVEEKIRGALVQRDDLLDSFTAFFEASDHTIDDVQVIADRSREPADLKALTSDVKLNVRTKYVSVDDVTGWSIDASTIFADPVAFLRDCGSGLLPLKKGVDRSLFAERVLNTPEHVRFAAIMDGDRIGGFSPSTMTPGKQALFALTLILHESDAPWPLLIDQPEDDLDSRSIFSFVVPYLAERKRERQIIMVTHDANLVVGADAEAVVIANRHGEDRPNAGALEFDYRTGALEDLEADPHSEATLSRVGIRDHCCEILDGGVEAFSKRRSKYRLH